MTYRDPAKNYDLFSALSSIRKGVDDKRGILRLNKAIDWETFRPLIEEVAGYNTKDRKKGGRPPFDPILMLKILVLQKYYGLSDDNTEYEIHDRSSFKMFLGLELGDDIPDAKTIWEFKRRIDADGRNGSLRLFDAFGEKLNEEGLIGKEGSMVDASFIDAPRQRNTRKQSEQIKKGERPEEFDKNPSQGRQKDSDARWAKKNNETHYGWKNHIKADAKTKLIVTHQTTTANIHDSRVIRALVDASDERVLADSAYYSEEIEKYLLEDCDAEDFIMRQAYRNAPLSKEEEQTNHKISKVRVRVEHIFGRMKQMGVDYCRNIGLKRATQHNALSNLVYNLDRYALLKAI